MHTHGDECAHCLAILRDDVNDDNFVKVADVGAQRMLYFSGDVKCSASMQLPAGGRRVLSWREKQHCAKLFSADGGLLNTVHDSALPTSNGCPCF